MESFGKALNFALAAATIVGTVTVVGGVPAIIAVIVLAIPYIRSAKVSTPSLHHELMYLSPHSLVAQVYGQAARDTRRLGTL